MHATQNLLSITCLVALAGRVLAQATINTPSSLIECVPASLSWSGGQAPYYISVLPGGQPSAAALYQFPSQTGTSLTWTVNIASGTPVSLAITDASGATNYAQQVTVQAGTSTSCLNKAASVKAAPAAAATTDKKGKHTPLAGATVAKAKSAAMTTSVRVSNAAAQVTGAVGGLTTSATALAAHTTSVLATSKASSAASSAAATGTAPPTSAGVLARGTAGRTVVGLVLAAAGVLFLA